ncbi:MAG: polymorphic toxin-type HINT domain-containing protein [Sulfuritalea sp.]|nr:polymorphic toxin-type HINT domain-containing protein [Sulfuritalea sp.]MDP1981638.1 polymorphic toxin-type HINT domain-containing protein [Sulfuritalea sp.]
MNTPAPRPLTAYRPYRNNASPFDSPLISGDLLLNRDDTVAYKGTFCFGAGTLVHTKNGLVPIEQIKVGDWVLSKHESGQGEQAYKRVTKTITSDKEVEVYLVTYLIEQGLGHRVEGLIVTADHPFYLKDVGWRRAIQVSGQELMLSDGTSVHAYDCHSLWQTPTEGVVFGSTGITDTGPVVDLRSGVVVISDRWDEGSIVEGLAAPLQKTVYNIEVEDFHTYFVGQEGIWVHNTNCGGVGDAGITQPVAVFTKLTPAKNVQVYSRANGTKGARIKFPKPLKVGAGGTAIFGSIK